MKTKIISKLKRELLIVEAKDEKIAWAIIFQKYGVKAVSDYTLLGSPDEITEEDAKEIVGELYCDNHWCEDGKIHQDYGVYVNCEVCEDIHRKELLSALESEIYWNVNPISKQLGFIGNVSEIDKQIALQKLKRRFDEAQEKTFDKKRTLIFVKNEKT